MKHSANVLLTTAAAVALVAGPACATPAARADSWYFGASGDLTWLRHSDTGGGGNISLGYRFNDWRIEGEAGYHGAAGSDGFSSTHYFTYMGNLYYDFNTVFPSSASGWQVAPYIGGGIGDAESHYGSSGNNFATTFHHHENNFAYQGMAGLSFVSNSMPGTEWSLGYRYLGTDDTNLHANNIELGVRFHF